MVGNFPLYAASESQKEQLFGGWYLGVLSLILFLLPIEYRRYKLSNKIKIFHLITYSLLT